MTAPRTRIAPRLFSFTMALLMTLTIFSGVASLSAPEHAGQLLARSGITSSPRA